MTIQTGIGISIPTPILKGGTGQTTQTAASEALLSGASLTTATVAGGDKVLILDTSNSDALRTVTAQAIADLGGGGGGGALDVVSSQNILSAVTSVIFTGLTDNVQYYLGFKNVKPVTDAVMPALRLGDAGGIDSGATDYAWAISSAGTGAGAVEFRTSSNDADMELMHQDGIGNGTTASGLSGLIYLGGGGGTKLASIRGSLIGDSGGSLYVTTVAGRRKAAIVLTQLEFLFSSGNVASGTITLYSLAEA